MVGLFAAAIGLVFLAAAIVGQSQERVVYDQIAAENQRIQGEYLVEHRSVATEPRERNE
jgi:hypothetical protein